MNDHTENCLQSHNTWRKSSQTTNITQGCALALGMSKLRLSEKERNRVAVLSKGKSGGMTLSKGAERRSVSDRQRLRIQARDL